MTYVDTIQKKGRINQNRRRYRDIRYRGKGRQGASGNIGSRGYEELYLTVENNKEASDKVDLLKVFQLSRNLRAMTAEEEEEKQEENHGDA